MRSLIFVCLVALTGCASDEAAPSGVPAPTATPTFGIGSALIDTGSGSVLLQVEFADTPELRKIGLMGRETLERDRGMVFVYFEDQRGGFWMKDTTIPLSIAFFDVEGRIHTILDMEPCETRPCPSYAPDRPYRGALEVRQGAFEDWGVETGDRITLTR